MRLSKFLDTYFDGTYEGECDELGIDLVLKKANEKRCDGYIGVKDGPAIVGRGRGGYFMLIWSDDRLRALYARVRGDGWFTSVNYLEDHKNCKRYCEHMRVLGNTITTEMKARMIKEMEMWEEDG
jgi:hypothetical protein